MAETPATAFLPALLNVVVKTEGEELPDRTFEEAGKLAGDYSKGRETLKKLKEGKKYYVRVKAYTVIGGKKVYGARSKAVNAKA